MSMSMHLTPSLTQESVQDSLSNLRSFVIEILDRAYKEKLAAPNYFLHLEESYNYSLIIIIKPIPIIPHVMQLTGVLYVV